MSPGQRLEALEGLRGHAALLVFLVHAFGYLVGVPYAMPGEGALWPQVRDGPQALVVWLHRSHYGVDLFFVLSGLLMADLAFGRWPGAVRFLKRRWLRIYPAYALSTIAAGLFTYWVVGRAPGDIAANALLLQGFFVLGLVATNPVTWSLTYEVAFYLAIPLLARRLPGRRPGLDAAWLAPLALAYAVALAAGAAIPHEKGIYFAYFALFIPGVALGSLEPAVRARLAERTPLALAAAAWLAFTMAFKLEWITNIEPAYYVISSAACGLVVLKACDAKGLLARALTLPALRWLGRYSYSLFLIHYIVLQACGLWLRPLAVDPALFAATFLAAGLALSLLAARLLYELAERFYFRGSQAAAYADATRGPTPPGTSSTTSARIAREAADQQ